MIMICRGHLVWGGYFLCMFELIGRVVSETDDWAGESWYSFAGGQVTEVFQIFFAGSSPTLLLPASLFEAREYKSNFECWNGTNVWWAPVLFLTSLLPYPQYFD